MTRDKANTIGNKELTRRSFVGGIASTAAAVGLGRCDLLANNTPLKKAERSRPNVLLIVADQHNADVMGNAGHPVVKTLEFLAECRDHGDFFAAHGMVEKCALGHNVYEDTLRVPLIVAWPKRFLEGAVNKSLAELVDLYPTLMDLLDLKRPKDTPELPGKSLISSLTENKPTGRKYAISENWN